MSRSRRCVVLSGDTGRAMNRAGNKAGFTLTELSIASAAAAVLALTVGSILHYGYQGWGKQVSAVEMQRDATFAMDMMERAVRSAASGDVSVSAGRVTVSRSGRPTVSFYQSGKDLVYDPDVSGAGGDTVLIDGSLVSFACTLLTRGVRVRMSLRDAAGGAETGIDSALSWRN